VGLSYISHRTPQNKPPELSGGHIIVRGHSSEPGKKTLKLPPRLPALRVKLTFMQKSKYKHLMKEPNLCRWFRKLLRRNPTSAQKNFSKLGWLRKHFDTSPQQLTRFSRRRAEEWTEDAISLLEDEGKRSSYVSNQKE